MTAQRRQAKPSQGSSEIAAIVHATGVGKGISDAARKAMCGAMRKAAEKRVAGVTKNKRRRYYIHAATLVAACAETDAAPACVPWVAGIRADYSRYPALRGKLDECGVPRHAT